MDTEKKHEHVWPDRTLDDMSLSFVCQGCGEEVLYW
jgi:hypothetical protein